MDVKRYQPELEKDGGLGLPALTMRTNHLGEYVRYKDYDSLYQAYAELRERYDLDVNPEGK